MPRIYLAALIIIIGLSACKSKGEADLGGTAPVKIKDFLAAFPAMDLPATIADSNIKKIADTTVISREVFTQFIPDSALQKFVNPEVKNLVIHPAGSIIKEEEQYLLTTLTQNKKITLVAFVLDKKKKYQAALQLFVNRFNDDYTHSVNINREPTFTINREKPGGKNEEPLFTHNGYAYNNGSNSFIKVVEESNEGARAKAMGIINPIDTLAKKNKFSGDYAEDSKNFISVRDGRNPNNYSFFMHFEKDDGDCTGELKGEMNMHGANQALYQQSGDPCEIDFTFEDGEIKVKERGNCGNHRGIKCYFDDTYPKKKAKKAKKSSE